MSPLKPSAQPLIIAGCEDVKGGQVGESGNINTDTFPGAPKLGSLPTVRDEPSKYPITRKLRTDRKVRELYRLGKTLGTGGECTCTAKASTSRAWTSIASSSRQYGRGGYVFVHKLHVVCLVGFSVVRLAIDRQTHAEYACKIMSLPSVGQQVGENESTREDIFKEIDILCALNHENVIFLKEYFEEDNKVYLITEMLTGGELLEAVLSRGTYTEHEARCCFVQLLRGIQYLHSRWGGPPALAARHGWTDA
ncbi:protein kinase domain-containing protein, partial [Haematococcus lacustris]